VSQSRHAEWLAFNERLWAAHKDALGTLDEDMAPGKQWGVWERFHIATGTGNTDDEKLSATQEVEVLYCRAPTFGEALAKYYAMKQAQSAGKYPPALVLQDRYRAGLGSLEPDEPPDWKAIKASRDRALASQISAGAAVARRGGERTSEQVRATVRNFMALQSLTPNTRERKALGIGRGAHWGGK